MMTHADDVVVLIFHGLFAKFGSIQTVSIPIMSPMSLLPSAPSSGITTDDVCAIFAGVLPSCRTRSARRTPIENLKASFYPYVDVKHTLRVRNGFVDIRLSDLSKDQPPEYFEALAHVLWSRLFGVKCPEPWRALYRKAEENLAVRHQDRRRPRRMTRVCHTRGRCHDLQYHMDRINASWFDPPLSGLTITWGHRPTRRQLGHYRPASAVITINPLLDHPDVPEDVIAHIVHHEMLHHHMSAFVSGGRRRHHTTAFRSAERHFEAFERAEHWLSNHYPKFLRNQRKVN